MSRNTSELAADLLHASLQALVEADGSLPSRQVMGALQIGKNVGLFVTSGRFSSDAVQAARTSHIHIELVDMSRFIELWIEHYDSLDEDDRALLRLRTIHVLSE